MLPYKVNNLEKLKKQYRLADLQKAFLDLNFQYRKERESFITKDVERFVYLLYRLPATYQVLSFVLNELKRRLPLDLKSVIDVGAGHGASATLLKESFPTVEQITFLERDRLFAEFSQTLIEKPKELFCDWLYEDFRSYSFNEFFDLSLFSYTLNEIKLDESLTALTKSFNKTNEILIIIEPGSKEGFERILVYRKHLIELGGYIVAPCPHQGRCPLSWCHFNTRVQRSSLHRQIKMGELNYEDEKFCYLIVSKHPFEGLYERVIDKVEPKSKMVILPLCTKNGFQKKTLTKAKNSNFSEAKKLRWGDVLKNV
jgi:ribosomal protein RSM22 (predicted rRNA methylase)